MDLTSINKICLGTNSASDKLSADPRRTGEGYKVFTDRCDQRQSRLHDVEEKLGTFVAKLRVIRYAEARFRSQLADDLASLTETLQSTEMMEDVKSTNDYSALLRETYHTVLANSGTGSASELSQDFADDLDALNTAANIVKSVLNQSLPHIVEFFDECDTYVPKTSGAYLKKLCNTQGDICLGAHVGQECSNNDDDDACGGGSEQHVGCCCAEIPLLRQVVSTGSAPDESAARQVILESVCQRAIKESEERSFIYLRGTTPEFRINITTEDTPCTRVQTNYGVELAPVREALNVVLTENDMQTTDGRQSSMWRRTTSSSAEDELLQLSLIRISESMQQLDEKNDLASVATRTNVAPTETPTDSPADFPTDRPTYSPTDTPTDYPTAPPTNEGDTYAPTNEPTDAPTDASIEEVSAAELDGVSTVAHLILVFAAVLLSY
jgi:hypothetical protein